MKPGLLVDFEVCFRQSVEYSGYSEGGVEVLCAVIEP